MQEKVLSALSEAGLFTGGGLVREKVNFIIRPCRQTFITTLVLDIWNRCLKYNSLLKSVGSLLQYGNWPHLFCPATGA